MANSYGTATALSGNANSLANGSYVSLGTIDFTSSTPHECFIEVSLQASTSTSGNKQVLIFLRTSVDGTNYSTAPSSTQEPNSIRIWSVSLPDNNAVRSPAIAISQFFGGALPPKVEIYVKNDAGVALAATGQVGQYRTETFG